MLKNKKIGLLGAGSMAEAMLSGIINRKIISIDQIYVTNRSNETRLTELQQCYGIKAVKREHLPIEELDIIVLAMKPKDILSALESIKEKLQPHQLVMSVLAGITTTYIEAHLKNGQQVVRVMPNTSSMISESATAITPGTNTDEFQLLLAKELLSCIGKVFEIKEEHMDLFTGIAGSGPAYFYYLMEHMELAGLEGGLDPRVTREIIAQTILGAARMVLEQDTDPSTLRENVTSPNGTTAAGLAALAKNGGGRAITQAIKQATYRSKEISKQLEGNILSKTK